VMNRLSKNRECKRVTPGTVIRGKWHHRRYRVIRPLGHGATGDVYLVDFPTGRAALKIGNESMSITSEVNVLKKFTGVQGEVLGPSLIDVDDWSTPDGNLSFYVMEYLRGEPLKSFIAAKGEAWIGILNVQLLADLDRLHQAGWVFGDLKPDNLMVCGPPPRVRWFDVGGTTQHGRSIKEYTEFFDRGYWGLGSRKAQPSYDLFAVAMIMINCAYPRRFEKNGDGLRQLRDAVIRSASLRKYRTVIFAALEGKYSDAPSMRKALVQSINEGAGATTPRAQTNVHTTRMQRRKKVKKRSKKHDWFGTFLLGVILLMVYFFYLFGATS
jgi:serine/threonine-protein kinase